MKHCPTTPRADDPEITGARIATTCQHKDYGESKGEKDHLLLFFTFVSISSLSFWQKPPSLSTP
jgi:hypothetical protein